MSSSTLARLARGAFGVVLLCYLTGMVLSVLNLTRAAAPETAGVLSEMALYTAMLTFPTAGVLIATRQPHNPIGWILLAIGLVWQFPSEAYVRFGLLTAPGAVPAPLEVAAATAWAWVPGVGLIGTFLLLLFPDGRLPSPRWRVVGWASAAALVVPSILITIAPVSMVQATGYAFVPDVANPLGVAALRPYVDALDPVVLAIPLCILASAASLVLRYRRARGDERQQLKWLAAAAGVVAVVYAIVMVLSLVFGTEAWFGREDPAWLGVVQNLTIFTFVLIPVAVGVAVLRYRLYDIDLIINRALVYGALTAALAVVYAIGVVGIGAVVRLMGDQEGGSLVVAVSTLAVAGLFSPLRRRIQAFIDYRFSRRRYDAARTLEAFSARLRHDLDMASLHAALLDAVASTVQPASVSVWLPPAPGAAARAYRRR